MTLFGVTGHPVLHSLSPEIFANLFASDGTDAAYLRLAARTLADALGLAGRVGVSGLNVTPTTVSLRSPGRPADAAARSSTGSIGWSARPWRREASSPAAPWPLRGRETDRTPRLAQHSPGWRKRPTDGPRSRGWRWPA